MSTVKAALGRSGVLDRVAEVPERGRAVAVGDGLDGAFCYGIKRLTPLGLIQNDNKILILIDNLNFKLSIKIKILF